MTLHEYAIIGHQRAAIGRALALASLTVAPALAWLLTLASQQPMLAWARNSLLGLTVSSAVVYTELYWAFNSFGWRWLDRVLRVPNLNGKWSVEGATLNEDRSVRFEWSGEVEIVQRWDRISIGLKTATSGSSSEAASIRTLANGCTRLSYSYQNNPRPEPDVHTLSGAAPPLQKHEGYCQLEFNEARTSASGYYFNAMGRLTFGTMKLTKKG